VQDCPRIVAPYSNRIIVTIITDLLLRPEQDLLVPITDAELLNLRLGAPVFPLPTHPEWSQLVEQAREALRAGVVGEDGYPLPAFIRRLDRMVFYHLERYLEPDHSENDRVYVLEFQGPRQYVMFGHSKNLISRVNDHRLAAHPHGFALLNAWASPGVASAYRLEQVALRMATDAFHDHDLLSERFYAMPFEKGLAIARAVFECRSTLTPVVR
jgi:hypothetical protein